MQWLASDTDEQVAVLFHCSPSRVQGPLITVNCISSRKLLLASTSLGILCPNPPLGGLHHRIYRRPLRNATPWKTTSSEHRDRRPRLSIHLEGGLACFAKGSPGEAPCLQTHKARGLETVARHHLTSLPLFLSGQMTVPVFLFRYF